MEFMLLGDLNVARAFSVKSTGNELKGRMTLRSGSPRFEQRGILLYCTKVHSNLELADDTIEPHPRTHNRFVMLNI